MTNVTEMTKRCDLARSVVRIKKIANTVVKILFRLTQPGAPLTAIIVCRNKVQMVITLSLGLF